MRLLLTPATSLSGYELLTINYEPLPQLSCIYTKMLPCLTVLILNFAASNWYPAREEQQTPSYPRLDIIALLYCGTVYGVCASA